ncbi:MAG: sulfatase, partial [Acidobacteria bacterium]|nr:sulfatase [Acidobacteriota bacterium]
MNVLLCRMGPAGLTKRRGVYWQGFLRRLVGLGFLLALLVASRGLAGGAGGTKTTALAPQTPKERAAAGAQPVWNVLLFTIDSCNASRMSLYGNRVRTTPNLDRWAERASVFEQAQSVSAWTAPGLASLFSGTLPGVHGVDSRDRPPDPRLPTLFRVFGERGYQVPNLNFFTFAPYYRDIGLPPVDRRYFTENDGDELFNYLEENADRPFFIWYHTTKVHQPYHPPEDVLKKVMQMHEAAEKQDAGGGKGSSSEASIIDWEEALKRPAIEAVGRGAIVPRGSVEFQPGDLRALRILYDAEIYHLDAYLGRVLETLRRKGVEDHTLVVVTADHGEELLEHGFIGHASTALHATLFDEVTRIPLVIRLPGQARGRRISDLVQQIDVAPTLLDLFGMPAHEVMQGKSLKPLLVEDEAAGSAGRAGSSRSATGTGGRGSARDNSAGRDGRRSGPSGSTALAAVTGPAVFLESVMAGNQTT